MTNKDDIREVEFINLTPHDVTLILGDGSRVVIRQSGNQLRLPERLDDRETVRVKGTGYTVDIANKCLLEADARSLPRVDGRLYIVPLVVAQCIPREDFVVPDELVSEEKDGKKTILGAKRLSRIIHKED